MLLWLCAAVPLRYGILDGVVLGAGPDVVSTLWGMWWLQQEGLLAILGAESTFANYPNGVTGSVLSPTSGIIWALLEPLFGTGRALAIVLWIQLGAFAHACAWLASECGVERPMNYWAGLIALSARYLYFGVGEASIVAVVAVSIPIGIVATIRIVNRHSPPWYHFLLSAMMVMTALENPYLAPILPLVVVGAGIVNSRYRTELGVVLALSCLGILGVAGAFGETANPDYPREVAGQIVSFVGRDWMVVDLPWARLRLEELVWPKAVQWTIDADEATLATGGRYVGIVPLLLMLYGFAEHRARLLGALFVGGCLLALGSVQYDLAFPFLLLNAVMDAVARPLTQPTRFLAVALVGLSVAAAIGLQRIHRKHPRLGTGIMVGLLLESAVFGGLGMQLPTTQTPVLTCSFGDERGVLLWPYDALDGEQSTSQLYQIQHGRPSPQTGIASWKLNGTRALEKIRGAGFTVGSVRVNERRLLDAGYDVVLVEVDQASPFESSRGEACGDVVRIQLERREGAVR